MEIRSLDFVPHSYSKSINNPKIIYKYGDCSTHSNWSSLFFAFANEPSRRLSCLTWSACIDCIKLGTFAFAKSKRILLILHLWLVGSITTASGSSALQELGLNWYIRFNQIIYRSTCSNIFLYLFISMMINFLYSK